ncbi:MAG: glycosyltransferase family 87 protein, partial [Kiritimatiellaeota bacterium]|nr:glycosyltransferase family 87 protein [Kiritimatiellota bacterium]
MRLLMNSCGSRWRQGSALALMGLLFGFLLVQVVRAAYDEGGYDLSGYWVAAQDLLHGQDPYKGHEVPHAIEGLQISPHAFIYPLFAALLFVPMTLLPYALANVLWFVISAASLLLTWRLLLGLMEGLPKITGIVPFALPGLLLLVVLFSPLQNNFVNGQINLLVLACCVLFLHYFVKDRPVLGAFWLATAIMIKLLPIMLMLFLVIRKQYRMVIYTGVFSLLFLFLPALVVGDKLFDFYQSYVHSFLSVRLLGTQVDHARPLLSLQGVVACFSPALGLAGGTK